MPQSSTHTAEDLLHALLDRFEAPKPRSRDITTRIDYTKVGGPALQDEFHRVLHDAERVGGVRLESERVGRFTGELARVRLADAGRLYTFLARTPAPNVAYGAERAIKAAIPEIVGDGFFAEILGEAVQSWAGNRSYLGFDGGDVAAFITVLKLTHAAIHLHGRDIDQRTFSRRVAKDSKALERCEARVAQLLRRHDPKLAGDEPREVLEAFGVVRRPHLLQVRGPIRIGSTMQMQGTGASFVGLPWEEVQAAVLTRPVNYVMTIENPTSFWRHCAEIEGCYLALLSDGFPARDVLSGMRHLVAAAQTMAPTPLYHWGDIDAGGVRIAAHLEDAFGAPLLLHQMTPGLARTKGTALVSRKGLERLSQRSGQLGELARWLATDEAMALEQEELDPCDPGRCVS